MNQKKVVFIALMTLLTSRVLSVDSTDGLENNFLFIKQILNSPNIDFGILNISEDGQLFEVDEKIYEKVGVLLIIYGENFSKKKLFHEVEGSNNFSKLINILNEVFYVKIFFLGNGNDYTMDELLDKDTDYNIISTATIKGTRLNKYLTQRLFINPKISHASYKNSNAFSNNTDKVNGLDISKEEILTILRMNIEQDYIIKAEEVNLSEVLNKLPFDLKGSPFLYDKTSLSKKVAYIKPNGNSISDKIYIEYMGYLGPKTPPIIIKGCTIYTSSIGVIIDGSVCLIDVYKKTKDFDEMEAISVTYSVTGIDNIKQKKKPANSRSSSDFSGNEEKDD